MEKVKKTAKLFLCISLVLMLLSGVVVSAVQTSGGKVVMKELKETYGWDKLYKRTGQGRVHDTG